MPARDTACLNAAFGVCLPHGVLENTGLLFLPPPSCPDERRFFHVVTGDWADFIASNVASKANSIDACRFL